MLPLPSTADQIWRLTRDIGVEGQVSFVGNCGLLLQIVGCSRA